MNELYRPFQPTLTKQGLQRFEISLTHSPASEILRGIVHAYLQIRAVKPTPYPMMPDGTQAVFISPHGAKIGGAQSRACDIQILEAGEYFGIWFYPGALRCFFELDLFEITDQFVDYQYFPCRHFAQLHTDIYRCQSFQLRARICDQWLLRQFKPRSFTPFDHALSLIYQSSGNINIDQLATKIGWSSRHLNRQFRCHTGLSTKTFSQTIRIQHACKRLWITPNDSLKTALDLGYFDQAHLLKDFRQRLSSSPGIFFDRFKSDFYNRQAKN